MPVALLLAAGLQAPGPAPAADRYPFWARNFSYFPTLSGISGTAPLTATAQWGAPFDVLVDTGRWADYPWYEHISIDWGDGTQVRLPTSSTSPIDGAPAGLARKTWPVQALSHTYEAQGSYTVRLVYEKAGIADADALLTVSVAAPTDPDPQPKSCKGKGCNKGKAAASAPLASATGGGSTATLDATLVAASLSGGGATKTAGGCGGAACPRVRTYDIRYMAFVPANHVRLDDGAATCRTRDGALAPLVFAGDDRGFDGKAHLRQRYRVLQRAVLTEQAGPDGRPNFTLASSETLVRPDLAFQAGNGAGSVFRQGDRKRIDAAEQDRRLGDCHLLHAKATDRRRGWRDPYVIGRTAKGLTLAFRGAVRHGLLPGRVPPISWDLAVTVDASTTPPRITARGRHAGFPAHELYVNGQPLARYSPLGTTKLPALGLDLSDPRWRKLPLRPLKASAILRD